MTNRLDHAKKAITENLQKYANPEGTDEQREKYNLYVGLLDIIGGLNEMRTLIFDQLDEAMTEINRLKKERPKE